MAYSDTQLFINGKWRPSQSGRTIAVLNPATEETIGTVAHADRADALGAEYDHDRWNLATDSSINDDLVAAGIPLPAGAVTPGGLGQNPDFSFIMP